MHIPFKEINTFLSSVSGKGKAQVLENTLLLIFNDFKGQ